MNECTKKYRLTQFSRVSTEHSEYKTQIKFVTPNGVTNWLDIENDEFEKIKNILIK